ncbi:MAG: zinc ribbon domain-containing protein [Gemmatimonadota bacterium]
MIAEVIAAVIVGVFALGLVLEPLIRSQGGPQGEVDFLEEADPDDTPRGVALAALKEIEFDRATGKLSDTDYHLLNTQYTARALEATREEERDAANRPARGLSPEISRSPEGIEAIIAAKVQAIRSASTGSNQGMTCPVDGPRPESDAIFCSTCGLRLPTGATCGGCHAPVPVDAHFCEVCGKKLAA